MVAIFDVLRRIWVLGSFSDQDQEHMPVLINDVFKKSLPHFKSRRARIELAVEIVRHHSEFFKDAVSSCIRAVFAGVADESEQVKNMARGLVREFGGSLLISAEFEQAVEDMRRLARSPDDEKRLLILQTVAGILEANEDNEFEAQVLTSLTPLASALVLLCEFQ
jgi:hypothetical protein